MKKSSTSGKVGRPKKSPAIPASEFKREVARPEYGGIVEWTYTETKNFLMIMKTFKSCGVESVHLHFLQHEIVIKGITNPHIKAENVSRLLKLSINPHETYRYYINSPQKFKISITEWPIPLDDVDEACNEFKMIYRGGDELIMEIKNATIDCIVTNVIKLDRSEGDELEYYDRLINANMRNPKSKITNIKSENLKKLLGKSGRKTCQSASFRLSPPICEIDFELSNDRHQIIRFSLDKGKAELRDKNKFCITATTHEIYAVRFPNIEIHKFLLHIKTEIMELYFADRCVIALVINPDSTFTYYIPV